MFPKHLHALSVYRRVESTEQWSEPLKKTPSATLHAAGESNAVARQRLTGAKGINAPTDTPRAWGDRIAFSSEQRLTHPYINAIAPY